MNETQRQKKISTLIYLKKTDEGRTNAHVFPGILPLQDADAFLRI
jgi:hypothetical protein